MRAAKPMSPVQSSIRRKGRSERCQDGLGAGGHPLVLGLGLVGRDDRDQLDLVELVLADEAARVRARRAGFRAEAGGQRGEAQRQLGFVEDLLAHELVRLHLGGGDQPAAVGGAGTGPRRISGSWPVPNIASSRTSSGGDDLRHSRARCVCMSSMNWPSARCSRGGAAQEGEARAGHGRAGLEIEAERRAEIGMLLRREVEVRGWVPQRGRARHCRLSSAPSGTSASGKFGIAASSAVELLAERLSPRLRAPACAP